MAVDTRPWDNIFLVSWAKGLKRYRTANLVATRVGLTSLVPLYTAFLRLTIVKAACHAGNKAESISTFKGTSVL